MFSSESDVFLKYVAKCVLGFIAMHVVIHLSRFWEVLRAHLVGQHVDLRGDLGRRRQELEQLRGVH